jgi:hypothetical protein
MFTNVNMTESVVNSVDEKSLLLISENSRNSRTKSFYIISVIMSVP